MFERIRKPKESVESLSIKIARKHEDLGRALLDYASFLELHRTSKIQHDNIVSTRHKQRINTMWTDARIQLPEGYDLDSFALAFHAEVYPKKAA